jgi:hypothetical protein
MRTWEVDAKAAIDEYDDEIRELRAHNGQLEADQKKALRLAAEHLAEANTARQPDHGLWAETGGRFVEHLTGTAREETWRAIHGADAVLTYARPAAHIRAELPGLRQRVRRRVDDALYREELTARLKSIEATLDEQAKKKTRAGNQPVVLEITDADRLAVAHTKQEVYDISAAGFESQRMFRNIILSTIVVAVIAAALLATLGFFDKTITYRLDVYPHTKVMWPTAIWPVEVIGALAGFLVAIATLRRLTGGGPYSLRVVQAALKAPVGALTAVGGMLLLQSGIFGIDPVTSKAVFVGWAFVFGASQELVTRLVDKEAAAVTEKANPS